MTGEPSMLQSMDSQIVGHNLATDQQNHFCGFRMFYLEASLKIRIFMINPAFDQKTWVKKHWEMRASLSYIGF